MSALAIPSSCGFGRVANSAPLLALAGAAISLYAPIYLDFAAGPWRRSENAHALIVMAIAAGAAASRFMSEKFPLARSGSEVAGGVAILVLGLAMAVLGKATETDFLLSASQTPVATGIVLAVFGWRGVQRLWFPLAMTFYLIIWPGWALDALTAPLKALVSGAVSKALYAAGLPVAHAGAVISAGPYQLLVADACAGLNSLVALTAVGAVYLYAVKHDDWRINAAVIAALVPIAIAANILRVTALVLISYFVGYDAGQGFLHEGAGLLLFAAALALTFAVEQAAAGVFKSKSAS